MTSWHEFLSMGGFAAYVWPAYGIAAVVMIWNLASPSRRLRQLKARLRESRSRSRP